MTSRSMMKMMMYMPMSMCTLRHGHASGAILPR